MKAEEIETGIVVADLSLDEVAGGELGIIDENGLARSIVGESIDGATTVGGKVKRTVGTKRGGQSKRVGGGDGGIGGGEGDSAVVVDGGNFAFAGLGVGVVAIK